MVRKSRIVPEGRPGWSSMHRGILRWKTRLDNFSSFWRPETGQHHNSKSVFLTPPKVLDYWNPNICSNPGVNGDPCLSWQHEKFRTHRSAHRPAHYHIILGRILKNIKIAKLWPSPHKFLSGSARKYLREARDDPRCIGESSGEEQDSTILPAKPGPEPPPPPTPIARTPAPCETHRQDPPALETHRQDPPPAFKYSIHLNFCTEGMGRTVNISMGSRFKP